MVHYNFYLWYLYWIRYCSLEGICSLQKDVQKVYAIATMLLHIRHFIIYAFYGFWSWNESPGWCLVLSVSLTESRMTYEHSLWAHRLITSGNSTLNVGGIIRWAGILDSMKRREKNRRLHLFALLDSRCNETSSCKILPLLLPAHSGLNLWIVSKNKSVFELVWLDIL